MTTRRETLIWMKDVIEHLAQSSEQLQWTSDGPTQSFLAEKMLGDLSECRRLCEQLRCAGSAATAGAVFASL